MCVFSSLSNSHHLKCNNLKVKDRIYALDKSTRNVKISVLETKKTGQDKWIRAILHTVVFLFYFIGRGSLKPSASTRRSIKDTKEKRNKTKTNELGTRIRDASTIHAHETQYGRIGNQQKREEHKRKIIYNMYTRPTTDIYCIYIYKVCKRKIY